MKRIKLENFRCYKEQEIEFKSGITLLIGDNASGKTSILKACKYVLSSFFAGFSDENTRWISPENSDFQLDLAWGIITPEAPVILSFDTYTATSNETDNEFPYSIEKKSKKNARPLVSGFKEYKDYAKHLYDNMYNDEKKRNSALPLFASFTTEDIHTKRKLNRKKFMNFANKASFGYTECLSGDGLFEYWIDRLLAFDEGIQKLGSNNPIYRTLSEEMNIVMSAVIDAFGFEGCDLIKSASVHPKQGSVYYMFNDGRMISSTQLSDGYLRIINIVTDIAFRCALLNREVYGNQACKETRGTVLIDEIDLHLHPTLQSTILKGLRNAFPNLQFIVTSHAPMIMSSVESNDENVVYKLDYSNEEGYSVNEVVTYGMDLSTISEVVLEQSPRNIEIEKKLNKLFDLIDDNKKDEAQQLLNSMKGSAEQNLPELIEAEALLNFTN